MKIKKIMRNVRMTTVLSIVSITLTIIPVIVSAIYSFLQADDFSHANGVGVFGGNIFELFIASIQYAKEMFETWQGTYTSMFLQAFLSPLNGLGMPQLRVVMVVNIVLFIASVVALIYSICEYCHIDREKTVILIAIVIICIFGFNAWTEVFNWFSGAVSYSFPLSFGFLGIAVMLTAKKKGGYFLSAVLMFLASGGSLTVGGACCAILITICIAKKMVGLITKKDCIIFFIAVIGALINTLAPGNYIRHAAFDAEGVHFGIALVLSIYESVDMIENLLYNTPFLLLMVIVFIIGIDAGKKKLADRRCLFTIQFFSVLILLATCFPICLGYNGRDIPNRGKFAETVIAVIILTTITMTTGYLLSGKWKEIKVNQVCIVFAFVYIVSYTNSTWRISELIPYKMWEQVAAKSYKDYYNTVNEVYNKIAKDKNDNVFICNIQGGGIPNFPTMKLSEDMSDWINNSIAQYYGKQSVQYVSSYVYDYGNGEKNIRIYPEMFETELNYVSIYKTNNTVQETDIIQELKPFDANLIISTHDGEYGEINIYIYKDEEGTIKIGEQRIEY